MDSGVAPFQPGAVVRRREVLHGHLWMDHPVTVISDDGQVLATLLSPGSAFNVHPHPHGPHPWAGQSEWRGPHVLQLYRRDDPYAVWRFFDDGNPRYWYINFETPVVRTVDGFDTDDHGLDLIVHPEGRWEWKDVDDLHRMVRAQRMTAAQIMSVLEAAEQVAELLRADDRWWSPWDGWRPSTAL